VRVVDGTPSLFYVLPHDSVLYIALISGTWYWRGHVVLRTVISTRVLAFLFEPFFSF